MTSYEVLALTGRIAWSIMLDFITDPDPAIDPEYRREQVYYWNMQWNAINQRIRDGDYDKGSS